MPTANTEQSKSRSNVALIGAAGAGKSTLAAALAKAYGTAAVHDHTNIKSAKRPYTLLDCPELKDYAKPLKPGQVPIYGAILVVSALDGPTPQTREHVSLCRKIDVPSIAVFISKADVVDDPEMLELVETEVRELLTESDYPGDSTVVVAGSALRALQNSDSDSKIAEVVKTLDSWEFGV